jgi:TonB-linked SusC/RagA family outer membrane protein
MKSSTRHILPLTACDSTSLFKTNKTLFFILLLLSSWGSVFSQANSGIAVSGKVIDSSGAGIPQVTVTEKGTKNAAITGSDGRFSLKVTGQASVLIFSSIGYSSLETKVGGKRDFAVSMKLANKDLGEIVVVGYGTQRKESLTGAISAVTSKDIERVHGGSTVSTTLAGKIPGVTFRMPDGRPGASANIQIRNMGAALYVIDGIQQDEGQFNNLAPNDIESITVLKDASAAIYGVRAANGVVVVTTKKGQAGRNTINLDAYAGFQNWDRFPKVLNNSYDYLYYRADAEINGTLTNTGYNPNQPRTNITQAQLDAAKLGKDPAYRSFDWRDYILNNKNAPQNSVNINITGGNDKVNYYVSGTNLFQNSMLGSQYKFNRSNIQSNVTAKLAEGLKVGMDINGRVETRENPGVPGGDDYWLARFAVLRNTPLERPYANDNPNYLNDMGAHLETNYAFLNTKLSGLYHSDWRVLQSNFHVEYEIPGIKGLTVKGLYSYYIADYLLNNHEYT